MNKKLHSVLLELGFTCLQSDRSVYIYAKGEVRIIMPVYIDDISLASKNTTLLDQTVQDLSKHFKLRDLGETKFLLGVEIIRDCTNHKISLSQHQYMLEHYSMAECHPVGTPLAPRNEALQVHVSPDSRRD